MEPELSRKAESLRSVEPAQSRHILVAEPDRDTRSLYRQALEIAGHEIVEAADGRDAMVKALIRPPRLLITETRLPLMDGYALCEILRRDNATRLMPIVVVTSEARPDRIQQARAAGANVVLVKPADLNGLLAESRRLLAAAAARFDDDGWMPVSGDPESTRADGRPAGRARMIRSRAHARFDTTTPSSHPPELHCPSCDAALVYQYSHIGGVSSRHPEQWDYFVCPGSCGAYEYRQRTRKLRAVPNS
jgi:two-component system, chemotaxis family, chemotaxis protein CheY